MGDGTGMSFSRRAFTIGAALTPLLKAKQSEAPRESEHTSQQFEPKVFDEHQLTTVAVLAELIIPTTDTPGARAALVHQHLDDILAVSPETARNQFLEGLWWLDGYSLRTEGKPFKDVAPERQMQVLVNLYDSNDPDLQPGHAFVHAAKTWTAKIYYSTEIGERELNKGGRTPPRYDAGLCGKA
jgi:hypothetical protein